MSPLLGLTPKPTPLATRWLFLFSGNRDHCAFPSPCPVCTRLLWRRSGRGDSGGSQAARTASQCR